MSLSFEDSLKKSMATASLKTESIALASMDNMVDNTVANMGIADMNIVDIGVMPLDETGGIAAYAGDDGNWNELAGYVRYLDIYGNNIFSDDNISTIDEKKNISLNELQFNLTQEENSQYIPFEMPRYYDGFDLKNTEISIHYETSSGYHYASKPVNVVYNDEKIRFGWLVDANATSEVGKLKFEIQAYGTVVGTDNNRIAYVWKSRTNESLNVLQSLCDCREVINKIDNESWIQELVTSVAEKVAQEIAGVEVGAQVKAAEDAANRAENAAANAQSTATTAVTNALVNYSTTAEMKSYVEQEIANADIDNKLTAYAKTSEVEAMIGDLGTDDDGNPITTVSDYVDHKVEAIDVSEQLKDYAKSVDVYTKSETYSQDEIDEALKNVKVDLTGYAKESYVDNKTSILSGKIDTNTGSITTINSKIAEINNALESIDKSPNAQYITTYNQPFTFEGEEYTGENTLVLYEIYNKDKENETRTVVSSHEIKGGSGTVTSNSKIERITLTPVIDRLGNKISILYNFINDDTGVGYATWKIGNRTIINKKTIYNGENSEDLTDYIGVGSDQKVTLIVTDDANTILQMVWYVSVIDIKLDSNFDDTSYYPANSPVDFTFMPSGAVDKTIHFLLDGKEIGTKTSIKSASGLLDSYQIPAQEHGSHLVEAYVTATINNIVVGEDRSIYVAKDIVWFDEESDVPVIGCATPVINTVQHNTVNIKYTVFDKNTETPEVVWYINDVAMPPEVLIEKDENGYYSYPYRANDVGTFELKITCGEAEPKIITLNVEELNIDVTPVTTGLAFDFNPSGYSNNSANRLWTDGTVSMSVSPNFDWVNGGYQYDENGDQYFCVKSGTWAKIDYNLFADDAKTQGKEFKVIFKTSNIKNRDTTFISCMNSGIGLDMKIQDANIHSSNGSLYSPYCEEDIIEFEFNINTSDNIPLVMTYEDGVGCRPMIYNSDSSFWQTKTEPITIGSSDCDVYIYRMKAYSRSLSDSEILSNFILDGRNADEIADRYNRNKIYESVDENGKKVLSIKGTLTPESLAEACPDLRVIMIDAPWFTNDKDDKVADTTVQMIYKNGDSVLDNWTCVNASHSGQGTSSNEYGYSGRNLRLIMNNDDSLFTFNGNDESGKPLTGKEITLTRGSVPNAFYNIKVNIASSENQNNAQLARRYNEYNPVKRAAKIRDSKVKDTMEFYNCVVFVRENHEDLTKHREFSDRDYHFYALGNIGDDKKTDKTRMNDAGDPKEHIVEITDYDVVLAEFPTGKDGICPIEEWKSGNDAYDKLYAEYEYEAETEEDGSVTYSFKSFGSKSYEFRYETKKITDEQRQTNIDIWRDFYKFVVTSTDKEFKDNLNQYFVVDSALFYYLFTERYTMVDNRAKNSFWHYGKFYVTESYAQEKGDIISIDGVRYSADGYRINDEQAAIHDGYRYDLCFNYDNDTALGIGNTGKLEIPYGKEDIDFYVDGDPTSSYFYRAARSNFFCRIRDLFKDELQAMFVNRESKGAWSSTDLINQWDNAQSQFPEEVWRLDIQRKYLRTYKGISIDNSIAGAKTPRFLEEMLNGRKKYQRRMFERNQELYFATKYFGTVATSNNIMMRFNNPVNAVVKPDFTLYITPYSDMYLGVKRGNTTPTNFRAKAGTEYPIYFDGDVSDINLIYGAPFIQKIGDLSKCYVGDNDFSKASRLQSLIIGNDDIEGYKNAYMTKLALGNNKLLEYLDIRNVTGLSDTIDLSQCGNMLELYAQGSGTRGVVFANGGKIQKFYLPSIASLTAKNLNYIEDFDIESYVNLHTLVVENTPAIDTYEIVDETFELQSSLPEDSAKLNVLRLIGIDWNIDSADILDDIILLRGQNSDGGEISQSVLTGKVHVPTIREKQLEEYQDTWSDLKITYDNGGLIMQHPVTFLNYDGTELITLYVDDGGYVVDPVENGDISIPIKESTVSTNFTYAGWDRKDLLEYQIFGALTVTATYSEELREYTIRYVVSESGRETELYRKSDKYGTNIPYIGDIPTYTLKEGVNGWMYYLFNRWNKSGFLLEGKDGKDFDDNGVKTVTAIFDTFKYTSGAFDGRELKDLSPVEVYALTKLTEPVDKSFSDYGMEIETGDEYSFTMGYDIDYDDVESEEIIANKMCILDGDYKNTSAVFTGDNYIDTGIKLFDTDKDFVLAIDYTMSSGNSSGSTLMQCYQTAGTHGFKLSYESSPVLSWGGTSISTDNTTVSPSSVGNREMLVIRHKQGDNNLYIYTSNLNSTDIKTYVIARDSITQSNAATLILGAAKLDSGRISNYGIGEVNWCKIWYKDLGEVTCNNLVCWTHEKITLETSGFYRYQLYDDTSKESMMSLLATHLLSVKGQYNENSNSNTDGWGGSKLNEFLNSRFYNAIPYQIKALIKKVSVKSTIGNNSTSVNSSGCFVNIPALYDIYDSASSEYREELYEAASTIDFFTGLTDSDEQTNRKRYFDDYRLHSSSDKGVQYWLRSPSINTSWSTQRYCYSISETGAPQSVTGTSSNLGILIEISF